MAKTKSSKRWLQEHFSDPYVQQAQAKGWRSRAVFKLQEIDERVHLIRPGMNIVDLGAAPGGWSQYAANKLNSNGMVIATDILPMDSMAGVEFIQGDFREQSVLDAVLERLEGRPVDLVMSDMAPNISGMKAVDQPRAMYLAELALDFAKNTLKQEGVFLAKVFHGEGFDSFFKEVKQVFAQVSTRKPKASRDRSREVYVLAKGRIL